MKNAIITVFNYLNEIGEENFKHFPEFSALLFMSQECSHKFNTAKYRIIYYNLRVTFFRWFHQILFYIYIRLYNIICYEKLQSFI